MPFKIHLSVLQHKYFTVCIDLIILLDEKRQTSKRLSRNKNVSMLSLSLH